MGANGVTVWPTVVSTTAPIPDADGDEETSPVHGRHLRWRNRSGVAVRQRVLVPRDLGQYVGLGELRLEAVLDVWKLHRDVHEDGTDHHVAQVTVGGGERPWPGVPVQRVQEAGRELDQAEDTSTKTESRSSACFSRPDRWPAEQARVDRPELDQQQRDGRDTCGHVEALRHAIGLHRVCGFRQPRPGVVLVVAQHPCHEAHRETDPHGPTQPSRDRRRPQRAPEMGPPAWPTRSRAACGLGGRRRLHVLIMHRSWLGRGPTEKWCSLHAGRLRRSGRFSTNPAALWLRNTV